MTLRYRELNCSKIISLLVSSLSADPNITDLLLGEHPEILTGIGRDAVRKMRLSAYKSSNISEMQQDSTKVTIEDQYIGSPIRAFDWCQNQRPWKKLKGHYAQTRAPWCCYLFIFSSTFSLLLVDK